MAIALTRLGAIVLAAGLSRRFGGPSKLLAPLAGHALLEWSLASVAVLGLKDVVVITGRDADRTNVMAGKAGFRPIHNPRYLDGMGVSLALGARSVAPDCEGVFVCLGDMPFIDVDVFEAVADRFDPAWGKDVVVPVFEGRPGHPVLFGQTYLEELAALGTDQGAKSVLARVRDRVCEVEVTCRGVIFDVDWTGDLKTAEDAVKSRSLLDRWTGLA